MAKSGTDIEPVPLVLPNPKGFARFFKRAPSLTQTPFPEPLSPAIREQLPTLGEYLKGMGYKEGDPVFNFVPDDRDIRVASPDISPKIAPHAPGLNRKDFGDSMESFKPLSGPMSEKAKDTFQHTIYMRSALDTMQKRLSSSLGFSPENMQGVDNRQLHLYVLFHEAGHTEPGNLDLPPSIRETNADLHGIKAVEAQYPGSRIADVVRNWRFIENSYANGTLLDRSLKGQAPNVREDIYELAEGHKATSGYNPETLAILQEIGQGIGHLEMELGTHGTLSKIFTRAARKILSYKPEKRIQKLQKSLNAGKDEPLVAQVKQDTIDAYKGLAPKMTGKALARVRPATKPAAPGQGLRG